MLLPFKEKLKIYCLNRQYIEGYLKEIEEKNPKRNGALMFLIKIDDEVHVFLDYPSEDGLKHKVLKTNDETPCPSIEHTLIIPFLRGN
ncbi:MAG: hypothetical protein V4439_01685 [Patescibacteria group bacterium]